MGWIGFGITTITTFMSGISNTIAKVNPGNTALSKLIIVVGILSAITALSTSISSHLKQDAEEARTAAIALQEAIGIARRNIYNSTSVIDARDALSRLQSKILQYE